MPQKLETLLKHARNFPKNQADLLLEFNEYKEENDAKVGHRRGMFVCLNLLARHLPQRTFHQATRDDLLSFLKSRQKSIEVDPQQKWQTTWNSYHGKLTTFYRWLANRDSDADPGDWKAPKTITSIKTKKIKRKSPYKPSDV